MLLFSLCALQGTRDSICYTWGAPGCVRIFSHDLVHVNDICKVPALSPVLLGLTNTKWRRCGPRLQGADSAVGRQVYKDVISHQCNGYSDRNRSEAQAVTMNDTHSAWGLGQRGEVCRDGGWCGQPRPWARWPLLYWKDREETWKS